MEIREELSSTFPDLYAMPLEIHGLSIMKQTPALEHFKKEVLARVRESINSLEEIKDKPVYRAYRDFFWRVGIDPTKTRPAGEALVRKVIGGRDLPTINTLVDAYNLASLETGIAIAAFDLSNFGWEDLSMRKGIPEETFRGIGMSVPSTLAGMEVVIENKRSGSLVAIYPYRDSEESKVTTETKDVLLV
ncbi:MAG TPA: phenylalanine--tRNA ligase beta subunit-related protein, partial [Nitrososphaerales archaeon]|nr:phenylalanine--tRNA ligase beta subunit-related protein [Nitrososphaerales archaeon]